MKRGIPEVSDFCFDWTKGPPKKTSHCDIIHSIKEVDGKQIARFGHFYWNDNRDVPLEHLSIVYRPKDAKFQPGDKVRNMLCFGEVLEVRRRVCIGDIILLYWTTFCDQLLMESEILAWDGK